MKYIMMMHVPRGSGDYQINNWSPEDFQNHIAFLHRYNKNDGIFPESTGFFRPSSILD